MNTLTLRNIGALPYEAEEALNRLRINLNFCGDNFKKIVITSSTPGEGKSHISVNLWRMLASSGKNVVLVDSDIRKSMMRSRWQITSTERDYMGLTHYLAGKVPLADVIYETNLRNAYMVPTSHTVFNPTLLLQSKRFPLMLDALAEKFDYVLVDTPPLTNVADGALIASHCDGAILVVRGGVTPRTLIADSLKELERSGCELMGVVLNRVEARNNPYYYKYTKYGYYSKQYGETDGGKSR